MSITPLYAGLLGLLLVVLSLRVIRFRRQERVSLGHAGNALLERRIRAQGNLAEYAPMGLILIGMLELSGRPPLLIHCLGIALLAGRMLHGWALSFTSSNGVGRVGGMVVTLMVIVVAAILNIMSAAGVPIF